jgi:CD109 antigen
VENLVISAGSSRDLPLAVPLQIIQGSDRAYLAATGSYLTQSIQGLEKLLQMPFGCGEQNMILFAPNVFVTRYLKETGQMKPEVMAKAEHLMVTGYQRQLTYRRSDGSFSAFGQQDKEGSLWLTSFVMKSFAQAKDAIYIDESVLSSARDWVAKHQNGDGSFDPVGFVHHQEMLGGLQGKTALTAYVAVALHEVGESQAFQRAIAYLEGALDRSEDAYGVALTAYALELAKSPRADAAHEKLMALAKESDEGIHWGDQVEPLPMPPGILPGEPAPRRPGIPQPNQSASIETTAYATLALVERGDRLNASRATRWLVSQRNSFGGFGSTQDTVVGLQALTRYAEGARAEVDATVILTAGEWRKEIRVTPENADVLQLLDVPVGRTLTVEVSGRGQVVLQTVRRYNVPHAEERNRSVFQMQVDYSAGQIEVNDLIDVSARIKFTPPEPVEAGMVVVDIAVPTGFAPETDGLEALVEAEAKIKRYEVAGRKVIFYVENLMPEEEISFSFQARALYPVKAQAVTSQAYAYYRPEWKGESLGGALDVR